MISAAGISRSPVEELAGWSPAVTGSDADGPGLPGALIEPDPPGTPLDPGAAVVTGMGSPLALGDVPGA